mgnify:FL=1
MASHLGPIGDFKDIELDGYLVDALIQLWDSSCLSFRIKNKEMTVIIEEVAGLLNLSAHGTAMTFPFALSRLGFVTSLG